jgi:hypothetical protein
MEQWAGGDGQGYAQLNRIQQVPYAAFAGLQQPVLAATAEGAHLHPPHGFMAYVKTPYGLQLAQMQVRTKDGLAHLPAYAPAAQLVPVGLPFFPNQDPLAAQMAAERLHTRHMHPLQHRSHQHQLQLQQLQLQLQQQQIQHQHHQLLHQLHHQHHQHQQHQQQQIMHHQGLPRARQQQAAQQLQQAQAQHLQFGGALPSGLLPPSPPRHLPACGPRHDAPGAEQPPRQAAAAAAAAAPPTTEGPTPDSWSWLMEGVLQIVLSHLRSSHVRSFRTVCRHWKAVADGNTVTLAPRMLRPKPMTTLFPRLHTLILTNCLNVRNRDLFVLAQSAWSLRTLTVGDDMNKPWVTNRGLSSIAKMTSLAALSLHDCNSVTNNGLTCLNKLRALGHLSLKGCRKITNCGLEVLQHNTGLTSLNIFGCVRISDKGLLPLVALPLRSLCL